MQFMDGMTAAEKIRELDDDVIIMFITNMTNYAIQGYQVDALDYVVKPVEYFSFCKKLECALSKVQRKKTPTVTIKVQSGALKLKTRDIYYIESEGCCIANGDKLLISRARKKDFMVAMTNYISNR